MSNNSHHAPPPRSIGALTARREPLAWRQDRDFRILSIDGGGIKGIFPAAVLARIEERFLGGCSIAQYFDLIAGTSTGGIIALGLSAGLSASAVLEFYVKHGAAIFPPRSNTFFGSLTSPWRKVRSLGAYQYERAPLERLLRETFGSRKLGDGMCRLNIPAFEGRYSEVYIYKTPHHPDFSLDAREEMVTVALATAAAPTFFRSLPNNGYVMVDGGVWANNPTMIAVTDALSCFDLRRDRVSVLSIGCGAEPFLVDSSVARGGLWHWRKMIFAAMHLQSQNALGQARLLLGADQILRLDPPIFKPAIELDDYARARLLLPTAAAEVADRHAYDIKRAFLYEPAEPFVAVNG